MPLFNPITLPDQMQPSVTAQGRTDSENTLLGDNVPAKLEYEPCWTNEGKDENELETFLYKHLFTIKWGKVCGSVNGVYYYVQQG